MCETCKEGTPAETTTAGVASQAPDEVRSRGGGKCYSGRDCTGKVLNNRDGHNCKNSGGKSWRSPLDGQCYNL